MSIQIDLKNKNGIILKTKDKLCEEDIVVVPDESILGGETSESYDGQSISDTSDSFSNLYNLEVKTNNIPLFVEDMLGPESEEGSGVYVIAADEIGNWIAYNINPMPYISLTKVGLGENEILLYLWEEYIDLAQQLYGDVASEEGWYLVDLSTNVAVKYNEPISINFDPETYHYGIEDSFERAGMRSAIAKYAICINKNTGGVNLNMFPDYLPVEGKICDSDIAILPFLQHKTVTENGTYVPDEGYCGLGTVTVNVESSGTTYETYDGTSYTILN